MNEDEKFIAALLSNTCGMGSHEDMRLFVFDLHCNEMWVIAKFAPDPVEEVYRYTDIKWKLVLNRTHDQMVTWALGYAPFDTLIPR